tara:strand:+ start:135 stop:260 length:126 start_codon:yes stop_codon:yes gene_type:complete
VVVAVVKVVVVQLAEQMVVLEVVELVVHQHQNQEVVVILLP